jgi:hypothetical protein
MRNWLRLWILTAGAFVLARLAVRWLVRGRLAVDPELIAEMITVPLAQALVVGAIRRRARKPVS